VSVQGIDIIICNITVNITAKDYKNAVDRSTHFELCYVPMLSDPIARQEGLTLSHLLHIRGKSKVKYFFYVKCLKLLIII